MNKGLTVQTEINVIGTYLVCILSVLFSLYGASFVFFFSLGYGAALLRPVFARPTAWRVLDTVVGLTMLVIAVMLVTNG